VTDLIKFTPQQIALVKKTVAKDCNDTEFNFFLEMAKARGLNPLMRHIFAQVHNKEPRLDKDGKPYPNQKERQLVIVVSREGQRALAERTGAYRPDERAPRLVFDDVKKDPATNPHGLVSAEVAVYKHTHGAWFPVTEIAYWEDYAPLVEIWEGKGDNRKATGRFELKGTWLKMSRIMLPKCAEMAALRKAFPDSFGGLYDEAEIDRGEALDLSPSEWAEKSERDDRLAKIGGPNIFIIDWIDGKPLDMVPAGQFTDRVLAYLKGCEGPATVTVFAERNAVTLRQFWGHKPGEALVIKKEIEKRQAQPVETEEETDANAASV
jgi:phage recombination protein Bet